MRAATLYNHTQLQRRHYARYLWAALPVYRNLRGKLPGCIGSQAVCEWDVCPRCHDLCELNDEPMCYECAIGLTVDEDEIEVDEYERWCQRFDAYEDEYKWR